MEVPIGEVQQRFAEAMQAAERGESVVLTQDGDPVAKLVPLPPKAKPFDIERARRISEEMGLGGHTAEELWPPEFDDPAYSRKVLGLE